MSEDEIIGANPDLLFPCEKYDHIVFLKKAVDHPKIIMLVTLREPTSSPWGSETAAPLFFNIAKELISYYNLPLTD